jgi:hypothetical protein
MSMFVRTATFSLCVNISYFCVLVNRASFPVATFGVRA